MKVKDAQSFHTAPQYDLGQVTAPLGFSFLGQVWDGEGGASLLLQGICFLFSEC